VVQEYRMNPFNQRIDCVVVTGAGRGIGAAAAKHLAGLGAPVLCVSRTQNAHSVSQQVEQDGGQAFSLVVDLADVSATKKAVCEWLAQVPYQRLGVVLAAGVTGAPGGLLEADLTDWLRIFQTNLIGNLAVVQALLPRMLSARFGRIVMFGGGGAAYGYPLFGGYALSKVATVRAAENLHEELKGRGDFGVVCLAPGAIETDMLRAVRQAGGHVKTVADISEPVHFMEKFLGSAQCAFSGRFVHVRDNWEAWLDQTEAELPAQQWFLRRVEP
jgi:3-oxoacyl-[acyl-carrier protein] reductase